MKDWRGTEIEVGSRVIMHAKNKWQETWAIGTVSKVGKMVTIQHDVNNKVTYSWRENRNWSCVYPESVTVLTKDMFPELAERVVTLEGDIEHYKSEIVRTW